MQKHPNRKTPKCPTASVIAFFLLGVVAVIVLKDFSANNHLIFQYMPKLRGFEEFAKLMTLKKEVNAKVYDTLQTFVSLILGYFFAKNRAK